MRARVAARLFYKWVFSLVLSVALRKQQMAIGSLAREKQKTKTAKQGKNKQRRQRKGLTESADNLRSGLLREIRTHNICF